MNDKVGAHLERAVPVAPSVPPGLSVADLAHANALALQALVAAFAGYNVGDLLGHSLANLAERADVSDGARALLAYYVEAVKLPAAPVAAAA